MLKRVSLALIILAFAVTAAMAAPIIGKVAAVEGNKVQITLSGEKASWIKKGAPVKFTKGGNGKIVEVAGETITVQTPKAGDMKVGDDVSFEKGRVSTGC